MRRLSFIAALCVAATSTVLPAIAADDFPSKTIRIILPFPPGGSGDIITRSLLPRMMEKLGQTIIIDSRPGAGGNLGMDLVAKAAPDGYTLGIGSAGPLAANASLYARLPFDPAKDFAPISTVAVTPFVLVGHPSFRAHTLQDLLALARQQPNTVPVGHGGTGTAMHLSVQLLSHMSGARFLEVPYKGTGAAAVDVLAGHTPVAMLDLPSAVQFIKDGKLVPLAVTTSHRVAALPDVLTVAEAGVPNYESSGWFGLVAPAGTPPAVIARLNDALLDALNQPAFRAKAAELGVEVRPEKPQEFSQVIRSEKQKWAEVVKAFGTKIE